jgi:hypothetical protein
MLCIDIKLFENENALDSFDSWDSNMKRLGTMLRNSLFVSASQ